MEVVNFSVCKCGAITLYCDDGRRYSVKRRNLKLFPEIKLDPKTAVRLEDSYACDHCVNHYGLDLCGCGSGERYGKCKCGFEECKKPMQSFGEYDRVIASSSLFYGKITA